jgi:hypothetical protein
MRAARVQGLILQRWRFEIRNLSPALAFAIGTARGSAGEEVEYYKVCARAWVSKSLTGLHNKTDNVRVCNIRAGSRFRCCRGKAVISTYCVCVCL